jgi:pimeloyl-ACP methyl ester carboxylesterase
VEERRLVEGVEVVGWRQARERASALLLHGNWMGAWIWEGWGPALADAGIAAHAMSFPGHGGSPPLPEAEFLALDAPSLVRHARAVRSALGSPGILIGHSLGGLVAQALAAGDGADGLVLIASAAPAGLVAERALRPADQATVLDPEAARRLLVADAGEAEIARLIGRLGPGATGVLNSSGGRLRVAIDAIACPVLVMAGARDASVPPGEVLARAYGAELITLPGTGHTPMIEREGPVALARLVDWIERRVLALP